MEDIDLDGRFEYEPLVASIEGQTLTFSYETHPVTKSYTLEGDTIYVHYVRGSSDALNLGFANAVNQLGVFDKDWIWNFEPIEMQEVLGWQMTTGGSVLLNTDGNYSIQTASFIDSPAREEMQTREDISTYTEDHYMCFPCSWIKVWDTQDVDFSLTLSAAPIDTSAYTPIPTPTPTLPPPTVGPTPSGMQWDEGYVIYDDALAAGWSIDPYGGSADWNASGMVYQGASAIEVTLEPDLWITFDVGQFDSSAYGYLVFYLNGGETTDQQLYVEMNSGETSLGRADLTDYIEGYPLQPDEWHRVAVPLNLLNPKGKSIAWFDIGDASGNGASTFYIDEIRFVSPGP